jgi:FkbM family methyltransferase
MSFKREICKIVYRNYFTKNRFKIYRRRGVLFLLNLENDIDRKIIFNGIFEKDQVSAMLAAAKKTKPDYFIDVGANLGFYSILAAKSGSFKKIVSFEPDTHNYSQLRANALINQFTSIVDTHEKGLSNKNDIEELYKNKGRDTGTSRIKKTAPKSESYVDFDINHINVVQLDDVMNIEGKHLFIKIDIEGHEYSAIEGMTDMLKKNSCRIGVDRIYSKL